MVFEAVGQNQQSFAGIDPVSNLGDAGIDRVPECRRSAGREKGERCRDSGRIGRKVHDNLWPIGKLDQEVLVLLQCALQTGVDRGSVLADRLSRLRPLASHAAAPVENNTEAYRRVFRGERFDFLLDLVFPDAKVPPGEALNEAASIICNSDSDENQVDINGDGLVRLCGRLLSQEQ